MSKITEHEMLVTIATMALRMDDLTGHDIVESFRALGFGSVVREARGSPVPDRMRRCERCFGIPGALPEPPRTRYRWVDGTGRGPSSYALVSFKTTFILRLETALEENAWRWGVLLPSGPTVLTEGSEPTPLLAKNAAENSVREILLTLAFRPESCERCGDTLALLQKNGEFLCYDCMSKTPSAHPESEPSGSHEPP